MLPSCLRPLMDEAERTNMEKLEQKDFSALDWRPTKAVDLRFWASALTSLDESIQSALTRNPALLCTFSPTPVDSSAAHGFLVRCLVFYKSLLDMGFFRQYSFLPSLPKLLVARSHVITLLTLEVFQSLTGNSEWQFEHRAAFRRRLPAPYASKTSGESEKDWNMEEHRDKFEFLVEWANLPLGPNEEEEENALDLALQDFDSADADFDYEKEGALALHKMRVARSRSFGLRVQMLLFCLFSPSRTFRKRIKVDLEDAFKLVFEPQTQRSSSVVRNSDIVSASKVIRMELAQHTSSSSSIFPLLISPFTGRGYLVEGITELLKEASAGPEMRLGLSFARVAMGTNSEHFLLRLETLLVLAIACLNKNPIEGFQILVNGGVYESLFDWVVKSLQQEQGEDGTAASEEEYFAIAAALQLFEAFSNGEEHPKETGELISALRNIVAGRQEEPLSFAQRNMMCCLLSLLFNGASICSSNVECEQALIGMLQRPFLFGGCAIMNACELIHECEEKKKLSLQLVQGITLFATTTFTQVQEYESILAVGKFLLRSLAQQDVEVFFHRFFQLYQTESKWFPALFFGSTSIGQHISVYFSQRNVPASALSKLLMEEWSKPLPAVGMFLSVRLLGELCHSQEFAQTFLKEHGLHLLLHRTQDRSSTVVKIIQNIALNCRKEVFDALCTQFVGEEDDFLCEMLVLVMSSSGNRHAPTRVVASLISGDACFAALDHLSKWEQEQKLPNRHYARLLHILPSFSAIPPRMPAARQQHTTDVNRLMESFALSIEFLLDCKEVDIERVLCRAFKILRREKSQGAFLQRLSTFGTLHKLIHVVCIGLTSRRDLAPTCLQLLQFLTERRRNTAAPPTSEFRGEEAMSRALLEMILDELVEVLPSDGSSTLQDTVLCDLVQFFVTKYVQVQFVPNAAASITDRAPAPVEEFTPSREVVLSLYDMGFHGSDIRFAQQHLRTNDAGQITAHLIANPRPPVTDEEELEFAMWLSMEEEPALAQATSPPPLTTPPPPPPAAEPPVDKILLVKQNLIAACKRLTLDRACVPVLLSKQPPTTTAMTSTRSPVDSIDTKVYFSNTTEQDLVVRSARGQHVLLPAGACDFAISTFVDNVLTVERKDNEQVLGYLACQYAHSRVCITSLEGVQFVPLVGDSTEFETNHIHIRRLVSFQRDPSICPTVPVRIVNASSTRICFYHMFPFSHWRDPVLDATFVVEPRTELVIERRRNSVWAGQCLVTSEQVGFFLVPNQSTRELVVSVNAGGHAVPKLATLCASMNQLKVGNWEEVAFANNPTCLLAAMLQPRHSTIKDELYETLLASAIEAFSRKQQGDEVSWDCPVRAKTLLLLDHLCDDGAGKKRKVSEELTEVLVNAFADLNIWELESVFAMWANRKQKPIKLADLVPKVLSASSVSGVRCIKQLVESDADLLYQKQEQAYRAFRALDGKPVTLEAFSLALGGGSGGQEDDESSMRDFFASVKDQLTFERKSNNNKQVIMVTGCAKPEIPKHVEQQHSSAMDELLDILEHESNVHEAAFALNLLCQSTPRILLHIAARAHLVSKLVNAFCCDVTVARGNEYTREDDIVAVLKRLCSTAASDVGEADDGCGCVLNAVMDAMNQNNSNSGVRTSQLLLLLLNRNDRFLLACERVDVSGKVFARLRALSNDNSQEQEAWLFLYECLSSRSARELWVKSNADGASAPPPARMYESHLSWKDELREMDHADQDSVFEDRMHAGGGMLRRFPMIGGLPLPPSSHLPPTLPSWGHVTAGETTGSGSNSIGRFVVAPSTSNASTNFDILSSRHHHPYHQQHHQSIIMRGGAGIGGGGGRLMQPGRAGARALFEQEGANTRHSVLRELVTAQLDAVSEPAATVGDSAAVGAAEETPAVE